MKHIITVSPDYWAKEDNRLSYHMQELARAVLDELKREPPALEMEIDSLRLELNTGALIHRTEDGDCRRVTLTINLQAVCDGKPL